MGNSNKKTSSNYWIGPYDVYVHNDVESVVSYDGVNMMHKDGSKTTLYAAKILSSQEYKEKYTMLCSDGNYHYVNR